MGTFDYAHRHGHLHLDRFPRYQLWSLGEGGRRIASIAENRKVGFCLMDTAVVDAERAGDQTELVNITNPDGWITELSHHNNHPSRTIEIRDGTVRTVDP